MKLIQEITQAFSRFKEKAAASHYVPPDSLITLTYRQLGERVREVGAFLLKHGMQPGDLVICYMSKSVDLLVSIFATMPNGGACYSEGTAKYTIVGALCIPDDVLASELDLPHNIGEENILLFHNCGAYGYSASPLKFLSHAFPRETVV